jgi:hypothetical protein
MYYIIERDIDTDTWRVTLPEYRESNYGVTHLVYEYDKAPSLYDAIVLAHHHRAAYSNWESTMFINGREVLFCADVADGIMIRYSGHQSITVTKHHKNGVTTEVVLASEENK